MTYKGILLDIDNTIYSYDPCHKKALSAIVKEVINLYPHFTQEQVNIAYKHGRDKTHHQLVNTASSHNRLIYIQYMFEMLGVNPILHSLALYQYYWNIFIDNITLNDGFQEFLQANQDKKIIWVTDLTADIQHLKIQRLGLSNFVTNIVTSEEAGIEKPASKMFDLALEKLDLKASEVCMIGDSYEKDIVGAINKGIKPFWLTTKPQESIDNNITTFSSFIELQKLI